MLTGGISVPSFVTNNISDNEFIFKNSKPKIVIVEDDKIYKQNNVFLKKFNPKRIICINESFKFSFYKDIKFQTFKKKNLPKLNSRDISTIIYF